MSDAYRGLLNPTVRGPSKQQATQQILSAKKRRPASRCVGFAHARDDQDKPFYSFACNIVATQMDASGPLSPILRRGDLDGD
jgi:hypothetical protein